MYKFVDTNEASESVLLPSEALKINGEYIENLIPGYRTLRVSGREALSPELASAETGAKDGSMLKSKRYPARTIVVEYQLNAATNTDFREAYNKLASILDVEDAELIFNDETDKFFIGTPSAIGEVEPGRNAVVGEFEITCFDPFKYSVKEYEVTATNDADVGLAFVVNYRGTYKAFPRLETSFYKENEADGGTVTKLTDNGDCGFVAFFNEREKILQFGDVEEEDGEDLPESQTLVNQSFSKSTSWGTAAQGQWTLNNGVCCEPLIMEQVGSVGMFNDASEYHLKCTNYGNSNILWWGSSISRAIPADAAGDVGAKNWVFTFRQKMCIGNSSNALKEKGGFQAHISDASGNIIAGVYVYKSGNSKQGEMRPYVNGVFMERIKFDMSHANTYFGNNSKAFRTSQIEKSGNKITFDIAGVKRSYVCHEVADSVATKITFMFTRRADGSPLSYNGLNWVKFRKNNCDTWQEVPNKFSANDVLLADCKTGKIYLNDLHTPQLGALGNDWEEFYLKPGANQIGVSCSDWLVSPYLPTFKLKYREVFL